MRDAACGGHRPILQYLIEQRGLDANAKGEVPLLEILNVHDDNGCNLVLVIINQDGCTVLHEAATNNRLSAVEYLIEKAGADVNGKDNVMLMHYLLLCSNFHIMVRMETQHCTRCVVSRWT